MTHNRVTPNLLMLVLLFGGLFTSWTIKEEVFPDFTLDQVDITVEYSGASPEEVEQGIVLAVEEAIRGIEGIEEITAIRHRRPCVGQCRARALTPMLRASTRRSSRKSTP